MYISDLEIKGFKSFAEPTKLKFAEGLTCIVGPNGCGKTNVVDAIRWVMGEQKSSVLRSQSMHDVIFNGTSKRKQVNFAEVSLTIHNDKGILPIEYTDVVLTRRVFRDGASEFFINKNACRLKDIHNLFVDTGVLMLNLGVLMGVIGILVGTLGSMISVDRHLVRHIR